MEFYGFSLWHDLLTGSQLWLDSLTLGSADDFDPAADGFTKVFNALRRVLAESGLRGKLGGCLHTSSNFPEIMERFDLLPAFIAARDAFAKDFPLELGMHCRFDAIDLPLAGRYPEVFQRDFELATKLGAVTVVAHFPKDAGDTTQALVDELLSEPVIRTFRQFPKLTLCWENLGSQEFFGSLGHLLEFRNALADKLCEMGLNNLIQRHLFCLDTGHLLVWRHQHSAGILAAQREIEDNLPAFARQVKVFHIHANDGVGDNHLVPFSLELFDHPSRNGIDKARFKRYSDIILEWLELCNENLSSLKRHIHIEALKMPFSLNQMSEFGRKIANLTR